MKIGVVGGGVAGMMSAITAAQNGADVILFEKNEKLGKKMYISGKGRCNITNNCSVGDFLSNVVTNSKFLQGAIHKFSPDDTVNFCVSHGLQIKTERGDRVFPQSDKSSDVIKMFSQTALSCGVDVRLNCEVLSIESLPDGFVLYTALGEERVDRLIVATGAYSYRATGSDGFGYAVAEHFGHSIVPLKPSLCRIICRGTEKLQGLSLKNVSVSYIGCGKTVSEFGEMLFTDDGISGPAVLSLSSRINKIIYASKAIGGGVGVAANTNSIHKLCAPVVKGNLGVISVDLKPALNEEVLDARVLRDFNERMNKNFGNALDALLPSSLVSIVAQRSGIPFDKKVNQITAAERGKLVHTLKNLEFPFVALDDINFGIVTSGGVNVAEVNPATMESKILKGLYFAGELLDVDAFTGGFNIQIALSTGYVAGINSAK